MSNFWEKMETNLPSWHTALYVNPWLFAISVKSKVSFQWHSRTMYTMADSSVTEAIAKRCSIKKVFLKILQNLQENNRTRVTFLIKLQAKKETLAQVFSCEFCNIFKSTFFTEHLRTTASVTTIIVVFYLKQFLSEQYTQMMIL